MMQQEDMAFNTWFIETIKERPILYDSPERRDKKEKDAVWNSIAEMSSMKTGKTILAHECKSRWKNLRACYTRNLKRRNQNHREYYLAEALDFILPYTRLRYDYTATDGNAAVGEMKYAKEIKKEAVDFPENEECNDYGVEEIMLGGDEIDAEFKPKTALNKCVCNVDADVEFVKSLLPDMKKMTEKQKREFKISILKCAAEILS